MTLVWASPILLVAGLLTIGYLNGHFMLDFKGAGWAAGQHILDGRDPYQDGYRYIEHQAAIKDAGGTPQTIFFFPVYPAPAHVAGIPFSLLPYTLAAIIFALLSIGGFVLALRLAGARDWRCYSIAVISWPLQVGFYMGALSPLLALGVALAWRYRERVLPCATAVAAVCVAKLFLWPLAAWLLATRRLRSTALALATSTAVTAAAWAAIGFAGLDYYPKMLSDLTYISEGESVSTVAVFLALGVGHTAARALAVALAVALLAVGFGFKLARRRDGDGRMFGLAVVAALVAAPIVWVHYLAILFVPIAFVSPQLSPLWFLPLATYVDPEGQTIGPFVALAVLGVVGYVTATRGSERVPSWATWSAAPLRRLATSERYTQT